MNEEICNAYSKAWGIINRIPSKKVTISERKELQELIKILANSDEVTEKDKEDFKYWFYRYDQDIDEITKEIQCKIQRQKAIIEIAERRIEEIKKQLL